MQDLNKNPQKNHAISAQKKSCKLQQKYIMQLERVSEKNHTTSPHTKIMQHLHTQNQFLKIKISQNFSKFLKINFSKIKSSNRSTKKNHATSPQNGSDISDRNDNCDSSDQKTVFTRKLFFSQKNHAISQQKHHATFLPKKSCNLQKKLIMQPQ